MVNEKYTKFLERMNKRFYTSMMDEYKRTISGKTKEFIFASPSVVFEEVVKLTLGDKDSEHVFEGLEFQSKGAGTSFVRHYDKDVRFSVVFRTESEVVGHQYHTYEYEIKSIKGKYSKLYYSHIIKSDKAVLGFNGKLGLMKFKKEHKKQAAAMFKFLKNKLDEK